MTTPCDFCGKPVSDMNAYSRVFNQGKAKVSICGDCAFQFAGLMITTNEKKTENSVKWGKEILSKGKYNPDIYNDFCEQMAFAETGTFSDQDSNSAPENINSVNPGRKVDYSNRYVDDSTIWTKMLKVIAVVAVVCLTIAGAVIGGAIEGGGGAFFGFLLGLLVGMIIISTLMVFVGIAEDAKATREYVRQIRNMMEKDIDNK